MVTTNYPLTVYKASAGSGKTFTLASEYIRLLVENPQQYRNILAVTFTNKATEEMKMRIVSQTYGIWKQLPDSQGYTDYVCQATGMSQQLVSTRAGIALHNLLHHYNYFRVSTIDTFFQSVLRNLARELDLTANLRIELNDTQIEEQAVDGLIQDLQTTDLVLQWILRYIMDNIDDDRSWNVIGSIKHFGATIFKDYYKEHSRQLKEKMEEKDFFEHYTQQLSEQRQQALERMREIGFSFFDTLESEDLTPADLKNGGTIASFFQKLQGGEFDEKAVNKTVQSCSEDALNWCRKGDEARLRPIVEESLMPILTYALQERQREWFRYQSASLTLRHLSQLRLLGAIEQKVRQLNTEANRFLLSDTGHLLHELIAGSDSPFIFEKIGAQIEHIMIDEFQDTSTLQWQNFKVLLEECMSHAGSQNLIVGDVKQSIYRWRSGDWRLLNNIADHFTEAQRRLCIKPLSKNYRSDRNIIRFNNAFFQKAALLEYQLTAEKTGEQMARQLSMAYDDVSQKIPEERPQAGCVSIALFPSADYKESVLQETGRIVAELIGQQAEQRHMAILIRSKDVIPDLTAYFAANMPEVNIVSDEAFRLDASIAVNMLIDALQLLIHPDDVLTLGKLAKQYQRHIVGRTDGDASLLRTDISLSDYLPEAFFSQAPQLLSTPLYDLVQQLYRLFGLTRLTEENAYVYAFFDYLNNYISDNPADIDSLLTFWKESLCQKTIQADELDGIRLLTIHKSKGLEFKHVILPFCDWKTERTQNNIIWCQAAHEPYNLLPLVPVDYSGKMAGSTFESAYQEEYLQNRVDNLNLLYVAFTRARSSLYVVGRRGLSTSRSKLIEDVLPTLREQLPEATLEGLDDKKAPLVFHFGQPPSVLSGLPAEKTTANVFLQPPTPCEVNIESYATKTSFRQSNKSRDFLEGNQEPTDQQANYIKAGSVLHNVFANIRTTADISAALRQLQMDGILYDAHLTPERLSDMLRKRLSDPRVADWFSGRWQLFNECAILAFDNGQVVERRPDRVMTDGHELKVVDFKFGRPKPEYHDQVRQYMSLLQDMGYSHVSGFLWYVYSNKIEEVSL